MADHDRLTRLDPVKFVRCLNLRTGRREIWEATSADGQWTYQRVEDTGTPWDVCHIPTSKEKLGFPSLLAARRWTAEQPAHPDES